VKQKTKTTRAIRPNAGVQAAYHKALSKLVKEMSDSVEYWLQASYKANTPDMALAMDALPSKVLNKRIKELSKRWTTRFDDMSDFIATKFVESGRKANDAAMQSAFKDAGWTVQFKPTAAIRDAMNATIQENVSLIKSIPEQYLKNVEGSVMRGFTAGRDLGAISQELQFHYGVTSRRAAFISRDQANKLSATVTQARRVELGLYEAEWVHSGAGLHPRPEHVKAGNEKRRYDIRKGCLIGGKYILPGYEPNCRCSSKTILPF